MGSLFRQIQNIHQDGKGAGRQYGRGLYARPAPLPPLRHGTLPALPSRSGNPGGGGVLELALRGGSRKEYPKPDTERRKQLLRLPAAHGRAGKVACRIRRTSQIRPLPARHAEYRRDRCHPRCDRRIDRPRLPQPDDDRDALQLRATRIGTHVAAHLRPFFRRRFHPRARQGEQTAPRPGQRPLPHAGGDLPARIPRNTGR